MHLAALADVDVVLAFDQVGKQVQHSYEIGKFGQDDNKLLLILDQGIGFSGLLDIEQSLIHVLPLLNQRANILRSESWEGGIGLVQPVVDGVLFGVLEFGENPGLIGLDMAVFIINHGAEKVEQMTFIIVFDGGRVDHLGDFDRDLFHEHLVVDDVFVVAEELS